jgi:pyruvate/2-oxoglutarate dehydrogenase complex dihydrolipoamide acyltransferase (E2) component
MSRFASAAARRLADELRLNPDEIPGSSRDGRITLADVQAAAPPDPPEGLGDAGRALWRGVYLDVDLRADEEAILLEACRTKDEIERFQEKLAAASLTVPGSKGQVRPHPLIAEVRSHRLALKQLLAATGINAAEAEGGEAREAVARSDAGRKLARQRWSGRRG